MRGFTIDVLRNARHGDCTAGGVSGLHETLTVVGVIDARGGNARVVTVTPFSKDSGMVMYEPTEDRPAVALKADHIMGERFARLTITPVVPTEDGGYEEVPNSAGHRMFGGNFAHVTDSRWSDLVRRYSGHPYVGPVPIHDRIEPWRT